MSRDDEDEPTKVQATREQFALRATAQDLREVMAKLDTGAVPENTPKVHDLGAMLRQIQGQRLEVKGRERQNTTLTSMGDEVRHVRDQAAFLSIQAGEDRAGEDRAGEDRAGEDRAGEDRATSPAESDAPSSEPRARARSAGRDWSGRLLALLIGAALVSTGVVLGRWRNEAASVMLRWRVSVPDTTVVVDGETLAAEGGRRFSCLSGLEVGVRRADGAIDRHLFPCGADALLIIGPR
jgi:hypothetical protein